jgi:hypothetical protein
MADAPPTRVGVSVFYECFAGFEPFERGIDRRAWRENGRAQSRLCSSFGDEIATSSVGRLPIWVPAPV